MAEKSTGRQEMERILGAKITTFDEEPLPGLAPSAALEAVYFSDTSDIGSAGDQMRRLTRQVEPPLLKHGSVGTTDHTLSLPDGQLFHALEYRGDLEGWRQQIAEGAKALGVMLGRIENGQTFVLSDGRTFALADCKHGRL